MSFGNVPASATYREYFDVLGRRHGFLQIKLQVVLGFHHPRFCCTVLINKSLSCYQKCILPSDYQLQIIASYVPCKDTRDKLYSSSLRDLICPSQSTWQNALLKQRICLQSREVTTVGSKPK